MDLRGFNPYGVDVLVENSSARNKAMPTKGNPRLSGSPCSLVPLSVHYKQFARLAGRLRVVQPESPVAGVVHFIGSLLAAVRHECEQEGCDGGGGGGRLVGSAAVTAVVGEKHPVIRTACFA